MALKRFITPEGIKTDRKDNIVIRDTNNETPDDRFTNKYELPCIV